MTKTRLFSYALIPIILILGWGLYRSIASKIELAENIKKSENQVIVKLIMIREAEKAYALKYGNFTTSFDTLSNFIKEDSLFLIEKKEIIQPRTKNDPLYWTNTDSIRIEMDTIGIEMVDEKLFPKDDYPNFNPDLLAYVPGYDISEGKKFEVYTGEVDKGGVTVDVIEVVDPYPVDKTRSDEHPSRVRWNLRFGSKTDVTLAGNWE